MRDKDTWNYRAVRHSSKTSSDKVSKWVGIQEIYYTDGKMDGWAAERRVRAETKEELIERLEMMLKDVKNHDVIELPEEAQ